MKQHKEIEWICTDPSSLQYGRRVGDGIYQFKEFDRLNYEINIEDYPDKKTFISTIWNNSEFWIQTEIDLDYYSQIEIFETVEGYYTDTEIENMLNGGEDGDEWVIAECIFEQESGLY